MDDKLLEILQATQQTLSAMQAQMMEQSSIIARLSNEDGSTLKADFPAFDPSVELWKDYFIRFETFAQAKSITVTKKPSYLLSCQSGVTYKLLCTVAEQLEVPKSVNKLTLDEINTFMLARYDPATFVVRERHKFWSDMTRKPGETIPQLVSRIRQAAATYNFADITKPQDEALRTRFLCSIGNQAVLKACFKLKDEELTFEKAVELATQIEDLNRVAQDTIAPVAVDSSSVNRVNRTTKPVERFTDNCLSCGKFGHAKVTCRFRTAVCNTCGKKGHISTACFRKQQRNMVKVIRISTVRTNTKEDVPELFVDVTIGKVNVQFELDCASAANTISEDVWRSIGSPTLMKSIKNYRSASQHPLKTLGMVNLPVKISGLTVILPFEVFPIKGLNLLGRRGLKDLNISVDDRLGICKVFDELPNDKELQNECRKVCEDFPDIFRDELGCLRDFELEVQFKSGSFPKFCRPRPVPLALLEDLNDAYDVGNKKGVWEPVTFCDYGTPVVPVQKPLLPGQIRRKIRVCGDYSVSVNSALATHRHPMPLPEELMRRLGGGYGFTKIDLADAYNQVRLTPKSQQLLALSTHRGVLLQKRLPFGITSAPGYFQEIMDKITSDLPGVCVYLDDILVSGKDAKDHVKNLRGILKRLSEKGLRCRLQKCEFAMPVVEYLGHRLSAKGLAKGKKVDSVMTMPAPTNVSEVKSFLGHVQFYSMFLPPVLSTVLQTLYSLTKSGVPWLWGKDQQMSFDKLKELLSSDDVLVHFNSELPLGLATDASNVGIGAVLFHRYPDGSERPIANVSKLLTSCQQKYSQVQKEALAIVFGLHKFHLFLYGRKFVLVTDHKPLVALFGPDREVPQLAANRLARWALLLRQYEYDIEYRQTSQHGNADGLSRLPSGSDSVFDGEEGRDDNHMVLQVKVIESSMGKNKLVEATKKDRVLSILSRYIREGWPKERSCVEEVKIFRKFENFLCVSNGCVFYGSRVIIPSILRKEILTILHIGHFGMERMKQLARTAVYWPGIDNDIEKIVRVCKDCCENSTDPVKAPVHPWMTPERPWSRIHIDHAVNFMGRNWLILVDAYSKYPCIQAVSSVSTASTLAVLEREFAHFGFPHVLVSDNGKAFISADFQEWCKNRGITHVTGAPYHPSTNGLAERFVQSFKQSLRKSSEPWPTALQNFLMIYRRTPLGNGFSPSELLNGRRIRAQIDAILPSMIFPTQGTNEKCRTMNVGDKVFAKGYGKTKWEPAVIIEIHGSRLYEVKTQNGEVWQRHIDQLRSRVEDIISQTNTPEETYSKNNPRRSTRIKGGR